MHDEKHEETIIKSILEAQKLSREDLGRVVTAARAAGGVFEGTAWEEGDGICPEWKFPWPPKGDDFTNFLQSALNAKRGVKIFPRGIINPDSLVVRIPGLGR